MMNRRHSIAATLVVLLPAVARAGAWGEGSFDNDDALDWMNECVRSKHASVVLTTLEGAMSGGYLEAPTASSAIAAAEVVAAAKGRPTIKFPAELQAWLKTQHKDEIAAFGPAAVQAVERVLSPKGSELHDLWKASKSFAAWEAQVRGLLGRVQ